MLRFSLLTLLFVVAIAALGSAALANPNEIWRLVVFNVTLVTLLAAALTAVVKRRPFAVGFAVVGWIYFALAFIDDGSVRQHMVTDQALSWLGQTILPASHYPASAPLPSGTAPYYPPPNAIHSTATPFPATVYQPAMPSPALWALVPPYMKTPIYFLVIGHSLWTLILACIGGLAAGWLQGRGRAGKDVRDP